jgi:MinD-like ATPase involved in chromosome partitioning or flagellar assembly
VPRTAVVISLPPAEFAALRDCLEEAGYEAVPVGTALELHRALTEQSNVRAAVLDGETDFDLALDMHALLREGERRIPSLTVMPPRTLVRLEPGGRVSGRDEYFSRPYSAESLRWRIEAMLIRVENVAAPAAGPVAHPVAVPAEGAEGAEGAARAAGPVDGAGSEASGSLAIVPAHAVREPIRPYAGASQREGGLGHGRVVIVFNPKGGVGKTTLSINVGASLQLRKSQRVLLVDCDTITGHIASSLGIERPRTLAQAWEDDISMGVEETMADVATVHSSGMSVLVASESPLRTDTLEPARVVDALAAARSSYDWIILDMHPDYGPLNQALFAHADTILVPVTPDIPCIRAAVQFRQVAGELGIRDRLVMAVNRAYSGVGISDVERVVAMPNIGRIRSAGMLFVRAAEEGKTAVERSPKSRVVGDVHNLADRLVETAEASPGRGWSYSRARLADSVRGFVDRLTAQVS